ncbi:hypothetical protein RCIX2709 [Methanocella arvoryzae MRE50]|uniref:Uncharacterized protein n=1 Tax=Methanocella arvoryzae (strain DSM 22066 / NBRC 105507 / MRE50) TaxID=351160 RepID=Q0W1J3_METAR|nr:hypothetical protein RCIX2709 [Methanocella arvoryzae MRE50]
MTFYYFKAVILNINLHMRYIIYYIWPGCQPAWQSIYIRKATRAYVVLLETYCMLRQQPRHSHGAACPAVQKVSRATIAGNENDGI